MWKYTDIRKLGVCDFTATLHSRWGFYLVATFIQRNEADYNHSVYIKCIIENKDLHDAF